jgi:hypothetical protein
MSTSLVQQIDGFYPALDDAVRSITHTMDQALSFIAKLPIPASAVSPWVDRYNAKVGELNNHVQQVGPGLGGAKVMCSRLMTIRQASSEWKDHIAPEFAQPVQKALQRSEMEGSYQFSWKSAAVEDYWNYVDGDHDTAKALSVLAGEIGGSLMKLADAIDKQNTDLGWAIAGAIVAFLGAVGSGIALWAAIGAVAGLPAAGVGAIPGALIGGIIGAIIGVIAGIAGLITAIKAWVDAAHLISDVGAAELEAMKANATNASSDPWPAPYQFSDGAAFRKAT